MEALNKDQTATVDEFAERHHVSREIALRFLLGRKWDRERADTLLCNYLALVDKKGFKELSMGDVLDEMATQKLAILCTKAKDGTAILLITAVKHQPGAFSDTDTLKLSFFMAELMTQDPDTQKNGITVLCNMDGLNWEQSDYSFYRDVVQLFQNNFPCRVKNIIVFSPPWWIQMLLKLVSPFLKPKMRDRIHMETEREALLAWIDKDSLPEELGGLHHHDHAAFMKRQMAKAATAKMTGLMPAAAANGDGDGDEQPLDKVRLSSDEVADTMLIDDTLAGELVEEREKAVKELDAAIRKRRASLSSQPPQQQPIDFAKLARSKAARLSVSLPDSMPLMTPIVPLSDDEREEDGKAAKHVSFEQPAAIEASLEDSQPVAGQPAETGPPAGIMMLSDDENNGTGGGRGEQGVQGERDEQAPAPQADSSPVLQSTAKPRRRMSGRKPRPSAIQM